MGTEPQGPPADVAASGRASEVEVERIVARFGEAYDGRDIDGVVELFAEDGDWRVGPGTFTGKDEVRHLLEWDVGLSPTLTSQEEGVGILAKGDVGFREHLIQATAEGIPVAYPCLSVLEVNEEGRIQHVRSYYDKLGIMHDVASKYPGVKGWFFRKMVNTLVALGEKGLKR